MKQIRFFLPVVILILVSIACSTSLLKQSTPTPLPTATLQPTVAPVPTKKPTAPPPSPVTQISPEVTLHTISETSELPKYIVDIEYPFLENTPPGQGFNQMIDEIVHHQIEYLKIEAENSEEFRKENLPDASSGLYIRYQLTNDTNGLLSVLMDISVYIVGAAHPAPLTRTINYDLKEDAQVELADLFKPGSNYLQTLSDYSIQSLRNSDTLDFEEGADPTIHNYRNWNVETHGLLITFEPYQVAPYAAGIQSVHIPFSVFSDIIAPDGPLALFPVGK
jgi:hypothetical protein